MAMALEDQQVASSFSIQTLFSWQHSALGEYMRAKLLSVTPWTLFAQLKEVINTLGREGQQRGEYIALGEGIWAHPTAEIAPDAVLLAPLVCEAFSQVRAHAYLRGGVLVGRYAVVGHCTECKNAILFDEAKAPHFNYVGDSVLGYRAHLGAGAILSNVRADGRPVSWHLGNPIHTPLRKLGALLGDLAEVGCNAVLNPGAVLGKGARVDPLCSVKGYVEADKRVRYDFAQERR